MRNTGTSENIRTLKKTLFFFFLLMIPAQVWAQTWTGATSTNWDTPSNWSGGASPSAAGMVIIPSDGITNFPRLSSAVTIADLTVNMGASLNLNNLVLTVSGNVTFHSTSTLVPGGTDAGFVFNGTSGNTQQLSSGGRSFPNIEHSGAANLTVVDALTLNTNGVLSQTNTAGTFTAMDDITLNNTRAHSLLGNVVLDGLTLTSAGDIQFGNDPMLDSLSVRTAHVTINGTGLDSDVLFNVSITTNASLNLTVNATAGTSPPTPTGDIVANAIGTAGNRFATIDFTADSILLRGSIYSSGNQEYNTRTGGTRMNFLQDGVIDADGSPNNGTLTFGDLYILSADAARKITFQNLRSITTGGFFFYRGEIDISGLSLTATDDIVIVGAGYNDSDPERPGGSPWKYPGGNLPYDPGTDDYNANFGPSSAANGLVGTAITGEGNFYVNGTNIDPDSNWF